MAKTGSGDVLFWCVVLVALIVVLGVGLWFLRRSIWGTTSSAVEDGLTLQQLRELRDAGEISEAEFQALRRAMIDRFPTSKQQGAENAG
ncbi:MAG: SHOCT domain-containing protein [Phycisphaerae bacterium]|nr:SHOCT domain-containing protein [Phycisphaerae bacterium]